MRSHLISNRRSSRRPSGSARRASGRAALIPALTLVTAGATWFGPALLDGSVAHAGSCQARVIESGDAPVVQAPNEVSPAPAGADGSASELDGVLFTQPTVVAARRGVIAPVWTHGSGSADVVPADTVPGAPAPTTTVPAAALAFEAAPAGQYTVPETACTTAAQPEVVATTTPSADPGTGAASPADPSLPQARPAILNVNAARSLAYTGGGQSKNSNTVRAISLVGAGGVLALVSRRRKVKG